MIEKMPGPQMGAKKDATPKIRELRVIEVESKAGSGALGDPIRWVKDYYEGGQHLFRKDPVMGPSSLAVDVAGADDGGRKLADNGKPLAPIMEAIHHLQEEVRKVSGPPSRTIINLPGAAFDVLRRELLQNHPFAAPIDDIPKSELNLFGVKVVRS